MQPARIGLATSEMGARFDEQDSPPFGSMTIHVGSSDNIETVRRERQLSGEFTLLVGKRPREGEGIGTAKAQKIGKVRGWVWIYRTSGMESNRDLKRHSY